MFLKLTGRVGDSPIIGAGTYAAANGGASATGVGESIMRVLLAYQVVAALEAGSEAQAAVDSAVASLRDIPKSDAGVIALTRNGQWAFAKNAEHLPVAVLSDGITEPLGFL